MLSLYLSYVYLNLLEFSKSLAQKNVQKEGTCDHQNMYRYIICVYLEKEGKQAFQDRDDFFAATAAFWTC